MLIATSSSLGREYPDSTRNPRGFATKFYTPDGNYDLVGLNWPIFFVRDPWQGPDNIRSQQRNPKNFLLDFQAWFDFLANVPESMHAGLMLLSDHGTPVGWRYMSGFGCHTFSWINEKGDRTFVKYHWISNQGTKNHTMEETTKMCGEDPDFAKRDLWEALENKEKIGWTLKIQTMTPEEATKTSFDPFDVTKIWPRGEFPMQEVGVLNLERNPENYFRDVEQAAFSPGAMVPGIESSPDSLLLWRMFFYRDAQYHRLGVNLHQVPVNCPFMARSQNSDTVDGAMRIDGNNNGKPQYMPNSFHGLSAPVVKPEATETPMQFGSNVLSRNDHFRHRGQPSEYDQVRELWTRVMTDQERKNTAKNTAFLLKTAESLVIVRYLVQCCAISEQYAQMIFDELPEKNFHMDTIKKRSKEAHLVNVEPGHTLGPTEKSKTASFMGLSMPADSPYQFKTTAK
jgi:catalase